MDMCVKRKLFVACAGYQPAIDAPCVREHGFRRSLYLDDVSPNRPEVRLECIAQRRKPNRRAAIEQGGDRDACYEDLERRLHDRNAGGRRPVGCRASTVAEQADHLRRAVRARRQH